MDIIEAQQAIQQRTSNSNMEISKFLQMVSEQIQLWADGKIQYISIQNPKLHADQRKAVKNVLEQKGWYISFFNDTSYRNESYASITPITYAKEETTNR